MAPLLIPLAVSALSAVATSAISSAMAPDQPEQVTSESLEKQPAAIQTIDPGTGKEAGLLGDKNKRKKQGFLESFGAAEEDTSANYGLL